MTRPAPDALARKALAFDLDARDRRDLERKAQAYDRLVEWLSHDWLSTGCVPVDEIMKVLEGK